MALLRQRLFVSGSRGKFEIVNEKIVLTKSFKQTFALFSLVLLFGFGLFMNTTRAADVGYCLEDTADAAGLRGDISLPDLIGNVIGTGLSMIGVLFFILMVYGGFLWMTAHGNEDQSKKAFDTIIAATIGILVVIAAYAITRFVFESTTGAKQCTYTESAGTTCRDRDIHGNLCDDADVITNATLCASLRDCCVWQ